MVFFDRYTQQKIIRDNDIPEEIDLGRYCIFHDDGCNEELTYSTFPTKKIIHQELLLDENKHTQEYIQNIDSELNKATSNNYEVAPLISRKENILSLNDFEVLLINELFHIEQIFREPHCLLKREIEKVHVSRSKRIPVKSYQHLASHTEDWEQKSLLHFKPSRILNEFLELNYDIYENQLTIKLVERCLDYLDSRLKEIQDLKEFLRFYEKLLQDRDDKNKWHKKIERNMRLIGKNYQDDIYQGNSGDSGVLAETGQKLKTLKRRLQKLRDNDLFFRVSKWSGQSVVLQQTNVIKNHKHYRYVEMLWRELDKINRERSKKEQMVYEQAIIRGLVSYGVVLIAYCLKNYFEYGIEGNYSEFKAVHYNYPDIHLHRNERDIIKLSIGNEQINIVVIGNEPARHENNQHLLRENKTYILYYGDCDSGVNCRYIRVNLFDPDSTERVGGLLRKYICKFELEKNDKNIKTKSYLDSGHKYQYDNILGVHFDEIFGQYKWLTKLEGYKYSIIQLPDREINMNIIKEHINKLDLSSIKNDNSRDNHRKHLIRIATDLVNQINEKVKDLKHEKIYCLICQSEIRAASNNPNYITCGDSKCKSVLSIENKRVRLKINNPDLQHLTLSDWGMDCLNFQLDDL